MKSWLGPVYLSAAAAIWGGMYVVSKMVFSYIPPWVLLELRFIIGLAVLAIWAWLNQAWQVNKRDLFLLAIIGFVGYTGSIGLQFVGTDLSGAAMGSLITAASPALISFFAWRLLKERLSVWKISALVLASIGVVVVIGWPDQSPSFMGNWILFGAAVTWALYTVLSRVQTQKYSSLTVTTWANVFGVLFTAPVAYWEYTKSAVQLPTDPWVWAGVLYIGIISTALAFYFWNKGFEYIDASTGSLFFFIQPLVGSILGYLLLDEVLDWNFLTGAILICIGIYLSTYKTSSAHPGNQDHHSNPA
ncbi:DMT family transporter [Lihuaxuella thermophila]|uniref:Permease of the drug/metabolite transporter (DMT) superfamily n=1 Tax=Lihuaxuella thermophila TaxID=1173111 RepID=A0A1H8FJR4_9BACL|nr:EamA family transporter [Lihuaxuella thermophila]SEN31754.1 Permease of the drug/metabolite transporter (DMT) superfamily [Lihuaxuella thermophila]